MLQGELGTWNGVRLEASAPTLIRNVTFKGKSWVLNMFNMSTVIRTIPEMLV